jgi:hypothetical protein
MNNPETKNHIPKGTRKEEMSPGKYIRKYDN